MLLKVHTECVQKRFPDNFCNLQILKQSCDSRKKKTKAGRRLACKQLDRQNKDRKENVEPALRRSFEKMQENSKERKSTQQH